MTYLLRTRLRPTVIAIWAVSMVLLQVFADLVAPLPSIGGGSVLIALFMASAVASALVSVSAAPLSPIESMSSRHVQLRLVGVGLCWLLVTCVLLVGLGTLTGQALTAATVRNIVAYCGIGYLAVAVLGELGSAVPVLAAVLLGATVTPGSSPLVRWAVSTQTDPTSTIVCSVLFLGGLGAAVFAAHRRAR